MQQVPKLAKVFVVEDSNTMVELLNEVLDHVGGFEVVGVTTTEAEARLWLREHPNGWDIAVFDLMLAQGSGLGLPAFAKRSNPHGKTVVFSSYATPGIRAHCLNLGATAVFDKTETTGFIDWLVANQRKSSVA